MAGTVSYRPDPVDTPADGNVLICCAQPESDVVICDARNPSDLRHAWSVVVLSIAAFACTNILVIVAERLQWQRTLWLCRRDVRD